MELHHFFSSVKFSKEDGEGTWWGIKTVQDNTRRNIGILFTPKGLDKGMWQSVIPSFIHQMKQKERRQCRKGTKNSQVEKKTSWFQGPLAAQPHLDELTL